MKHLDILGNISMEELLRQFNYIPTGRPGIVRGFHDGVTENQAREAIEAVNPGLNYCAVSTYPRGFTDEEKIAKPEGGHAHYTVIVALRKAPDLHKILDDQIKAIAELEGIKPSDIIQRKSITL